MWKYKFFMEYKNGETVNFLYKLTVNIVTLIGIFSVFLFFIYIMGNFQGFQDSSQKIILYTLGISSTFFALVSIIGVIEGILILFVKNVFSVLKKIAFIVSMLICFFVGTSFVLMSIFLNVLSTGI